MAEGRQASANFSVRSYKNHYADIRAILGNDLKAYYMHYIRSGQQEGRVAVGFDDEVPAPDASEIAAAQKAAAIAEALGRNLGACLNWSASMPYERNNSFDSTKTTAFLANYGFDNRKGNCGVMAATFYEMAKYLGYDAHQVWGTVPLRRGGMGMHSWVEIDINGETFVCDPDFQNETKKNGYMIHYKDPGTWRYTDYHRVN